MEPGLDNEKQSIPGVATISSITINNYWQWANRDIKFIKKNLGSSQLNIFDKRGLIVYSNMSLCKPRLDVCWYVLRVF